MALTSTLVRAAVALTFFAVLALAAACDAECSGVRCGMCAPPITIVVDVEGAIVPAVSGAPDEALACVSDLGTTNCRSQAALGLGTYAYDVSVDGRVQRVSVVVGPGTGACCDCGYREAPERVTFPDGGA